MMGFEDCIEVNKHVHVINECGKLTTVFK